MDTTAINGKRVLEPYVGISPIPALPELDHVDIDGAVYDSELPPRAQWPDSTSRPSKSAVQSEAAQDVWISPLLRTRGCYSQLYL
jgi:hypothetical protein